MALQMEEHSMEFLEKAIKALVAVRDSHNADATWQSAVEYCVSFSQSTIKLSMDAISIFKDGIQLLNTKLNKVIKERDLLKMQIMKFEQERKKLSDKLKFQSLEIINLKALIRASSLSETLEDAMNRTPDNEVKTIVSNDTEDQEVHPNLSSLPRDSSPTPVFIVDGQAKIDYFTKAIVETIPPLNDIEVSDSKNFDLSCSGTRTNGYIFKDLHITTHDDKDSTSNNILDAKNKQDFEDGSLNVGESEQQLDAKSEEHILEKENESVKIRIKEESIIEANENQEEETGRQSDHLDGWQIERQMKVEPPLESDYNEPFTRIEENLVEQGTDNTSGSLSGFNVPQQQQPQQQQPIPHASRLSTACFSPGDGKMTADGVQTKRQHVCDICGKLISNRSNLNKHRRLHISQKQFRCTECGVCFPKLEALQMHVRTHTWEKPYVCECRKRFAERGNYKQHKTTHLNSEHSNQQSYMLTLCMKKHT